MFQLLGPVRVMEDGVGVDVGGPKQRMLLALLCVDANRVVPVERLTESLWNGDRPGDPKAALQVAISKLRRALGEVPADIDFRAPGYILSVDRDRVDLHRFADLVDEGLGELAHDAHVAASLLRDALGLIAGEPFADIGDCPALEAEAQRVEDLRLRALEGRLEADLRLGYHRQLIAELRDLADRYPWHERFWGLLMQALYRSGRQAEALEAFATARARLGEELGIDPSPELQRIHEHVLRQDRVLDEPPGAPTAGRAPIRTVRGYELYQRIGAGAFGIVYRGRQQAVDREVAIKVIRPELANDPDFIRRFEIEAQTIARLEHLHIVPLLDFWREPDAAYLVMRWLRGGSLEQALRRGPWNLEPALAVVQQVAAALDHAHRYGVVHGDVKPANILLDEADNAYLSDFAIDRGRHQPPTAPGSVPYLAPEDVAENEVTPATDVFALGLVTFQLLTGVHPYRDETGDTLPKRVLGRPLADLDGLAARLPAHVVDALRRATAIDPDDRFPTASAFADALGGAAVARDAPPRHRNPYKGLRAFSEVDAPDFFGREEHVRRLLDHLAGGDAGPGRFLAVVGPSGTGKSSLVRAGLLPALRNGALPGSSRWFFTTMLPGDDVATQLGHALVDIANCPPWMITDAIASGVDGLKRAVALALPHRDAELVVVIDQFEELFAPTAGDDRATFVRQLHRAAMDHDARLRVIATVRSDFYDTLLRDPGLGDLMATNTFAISAMTRAELTQAIVRPAEAMGVRVMSHATDRMIADIEGAPAALPLLQYALTELFERCDGDRITAEDYADIGGIEGALARRAEALWSELDDAGQQACRQILLRLFGVTEDRRITRRRVLREDLSSLAAPAAVADVLQSFGEHRLLTFDRDPDSRASTVEIAHEALVSAWKRLETWIQDAHADLVVHERLRRAADEWDAAGRDESYLLRASRLDEFRTWAPTTAVGLTGPEQQFLDASLAAEQERQERERARQQREDALERRSARRLRTIAVVATVAALVATGLTGLAFRERDRANQQREVADEQRLRAEEQERASRARQLAAASSGALDTEPQLGILLAIEAVEVTRSVDGAPLPEAESALREAIMASHVQARLPSGGGVDVASDGRIATLGMDGSLSVWEADTHTEPAARLPGQSAAVDLRTLGVGHADTVSFSPDGGRLVAPDGDHRGVIRDSRSLRALTTLDGQLIMPTFGPRGDVVVGVLIDPDDVPGEASVVGVWDAGSGALLRTLGPNESSIEGLAVSPDGAAVATTSPAGTTLWDLATGEPLWTLDDGHAGYAVGYAPDGAHVAVGASSGAVLVIDAATGQRVRSLAGGTSIVGAVVFSDDGTRLAAGDNAGVRVWDTGTWGIHVEAQGQSRVEGAVFVSGGRLVTTGQEDDTVVWDVRVPSGYEWGAIPVASAPHQVSVHPTADRVAVASPEGHVVVWRLSDLTPVMTLETDDFIHTVAYSRDGSTIVAAGIVGGRPEQLDLSLVERVHVWSADGERRATLEDVTPAGWDLTVSPDGDRIAHAGGSGIIRVVSIDTGEEVVRRQHPGQAYRVEFTADGQQLVVGAQDAAFVLDATTGAVDTRFEVERSVIDVSVLNGDEVLLVELGGRTTRRSLDGETVEVLTAGGGGIGTVATGGGLMAWSGASSIVVRELDNGRARFNVDYADEPQLVRISGGGRFVVTVGAHPWALVHVVDIDELLELARQRAGRTLTSDECQEYLGSDCP